MTRPPWKQGAVLPAASAKGGSDASSTAEFGRGSTFTIDPPASLPAKEERLETTGEITQGSGTVLLVDDEESV